MEVGREAGAIESNDYDIPLKRPTYKERGQISQAGVSKNRRAVQAMAASISVALVSGIFRMSWPNTAQD